MSASNTLRPIDLLGITSTLLLALIIFNFKVQIRLMEKNSDSIAAITKRIDGLTIEYRLIQQDAGYVKNAIKDIEKDLESVESEFRVIKDNLKMKR